MKLPNQLSYPIFSVLRSIEQVSLNGHAKNSDEWKKAIFDELKKHTELKNLYKVVSCKSNS